MFALLHFEQIGDLSDERVALAWVQKTYYQAYCGVNKFQWNIPYVNITVKKKIIMAQRRLKTMSNALLRDIKHGNFPKSDSLN